MALGTWEGIGQFTGTWLGISMWIATAPVIAIDGPLPIADAAWMYANMRNTNNLRKKGGLIGSGLDNYLAEPDEAIISFTTPELEIKSPTKNPTEYVFDKLPEGSGFIMGSFLDFSGLKYDFSGLEFAPTYTPEQAEVAALVIAPGFFMFPSTLRDSKWPAWN